MKKVLAIILAAVLVLSCNMTAFADFGINEVTIGPPYSKSFSGTIDGVNYDGNCTSNRTNLAVNRKKGESPKNISVDMPNEFLTVYSNVEGNGFGAEIPSVKASTKNYENSTSTVRIKGDVVESGSAHAVDASEHAYVEIEGEIFESDAGNAVNATQYSEVEVGKKVTEYDAGNAIDADTSTVTVTGDVEENDDGSAIAADNSTVTVTGNVVENDDGTAIYARGESTTVTVIGNVEGNGNGYAINAESFAKVIVGGNVKSNDYPDAIRTQVGETIIVEGVVNGNLDGQNNDTGHTYLGQLNGEIQNKSLYGVHYLIGTDIGSALPNTDFTIIDGSGLLKATDGVFDTVEGVKKEGKAKEYYYTKTADPDAFKNKTITLSPTKKGIMTVSGLEGADATAEQNADGSVNIKFGDSFKGGLQKLIVTIQELFTAVFDADGGSPVPDPQDVKEGDQVQKPSTNPTKDGYTFRYWAADGTAYDFEKAVDGDITLVAVWDKNSSRSNRSSGGATVFTGTTGNPVTNGSWTKNADGIWAYTSAYKFSNTWGYIANPGDANSAAWYYFDRNGNMLTGWQKLYWNGAYKWFYFSQTKDSNEGKCQLGGVTPDGWTVDESGAWVESIARK